MDGQPNIVPTDINSLAFARTPAQVLNIVSGSGAANNQLCFPDKLNGAILEMAVARVLAKASGSVLKKRTKKLFSLAGWRC